METKKEEAIVLRVRRYGEADAIVSLFTKETGLLSAIAKGALRSRKRFGGALEIGTWIHSIYETRQGRDLAFLKEASPLKTIHPWRASWKTITLGSFALELALKLLPEHQPAKGKFELLHSFLDNLEESLGTEQIFSFQQHWLSLSGWEPDFDVCGICGLALNKIVAEGSLQPVFDHYWQHILSKPLLSRKLLDDALLV